MRGVTAGNLAIEMQVPLRKGRPKDYKEIPRDFSGFHASASEKKIPVIAVAISLLAIAFLSKKHNAIFKAFFRKTTMLFSGSHLQWTYQKATDKTTHKKGPALPVKLVTAYSRIR